MTETSETLPTSSPQGPEEEVFMSPPRPERCKPGGRGVSRGVGQVEIGPLYPLGSESDFVSSLDDGLLSPEVYTYVLIRVYSYNSVSPVCFVSHSLCRPLCPTISLSSSHP